VRLHYVDARASLDDWRGFACIAPFTDDGKDVLWDEATEAADLRQCGGSAPVVGAGFADAPPAALRAASYAGFGKSLAAHVYQHGEVELLACDALKLYSHAGESEGDFRARLSLAAREQRDAAVQALRDRYAQKVRTLDDQLRRAGERVARERSQQTQSRLDTAVSIGSSVLGALFGGKRGALGRIGTAARSAGRMQRESGEVVRAEEGLDVLKARLAELNTSIEQEVATLSQSLDAGRLALRRVSIAPRKGDIAVGNVMLAWVPWRTGADGLPAPAWP
jgi:molybdopterin converting factor small subunit